MNASFHESDLITPRLEDAEFELFRALIYEQAGISLAPMKKSLVENRLSKRVRELSLGSFGEYYEKIISDLANKEMQVVVDLLTTNETYFFREPQHFDFLKNSILQDLPRFQQFNIWCAASSTGEEPYSLAMTLAESLGIQSNWKILATDINSQVLEKARKAKYTLGMKDAIPEQYLNKYCKKDTSESQGSISIDNALQLRTQFEKLNLMGNWASHVNNFDVVFIRNVMIYFDLETRKKLVDRIADRMKMGAYLIVSHSETLNKVTTRFKMLKPSIYVRVA